MSIAEIERFIKGARWRLQQQAQFDYCLSNLIGISSARMMSSEITLPPIEEVYTNLFEEKKKEEIELDEHSQKSVNNFLAAAMAINKAKRAKKQMEVKEQ